MASGAVPTPASKNLDHLVKLIECAICTDVCTDPRYLPCIHTYCLNCIAGCCRDKQPGDQVPCPLCRSPFQIPPNGAAGLPKNIFFVDIKDVITRLRASTVPVGTQSHPSTCDVCSAASLADDGDGLCGALSSAAAAAVLPRPATVFCLDCQRKFCDACDADHRRRLASQAAQPHVVVPLGEEGVVGESLLQIRLDAVALASGPENCRVLLEDLDGERDVLVDRIGRIEREICDRAERLQSMVERHKEKHLSDLSVIKQARLKEVDIVRADIQRKAVTMDGFKKCLEDVLTKGTAVEFVRSAPTLHRNALDVLNFESIERAMNQLQILRDGVTFVTSSTQVVDDEKVTLGKIVTASLTPAAAPTLTLPRLKFTVQKGNHVYAVASLGQNVYVVRRNSQQIEVYDADTFALRHHIVVSGLYRMLFGSQRPSGLAACDVNNCLYVSDFDYNVVIRINLVRGRNGDGQGKADETQWPVAEGPRGLSITAASNNDVLVTCSKAHRLQEYTTRGTLVREIDLVQPGSLGAVDVWHAIQLPSGQFVVSQYTTPGRVCIVGVDGHLQGSYGANEQLRNPTGLAVSRNGFILVADSANNRILSLSPTLASAQHLPLTVDGGLDGPWTLWLDEGRSRLHVGEWDGCRLLVFDSVTCHEFV